MTDQQQLATAIRGWVHMDNLVESHQRQAANARQMRVKYETEALALMKKMGLAQSRIQVSGGTTLSLTEKKTQGGLTWAYLERELPRSGLKPEQVGVVLEWLHSHRDTKVTECLKKDTPHNTA
jgi:hypothetical protein